MFSFLLSCIRLFGLFAGINIYLRIKVLKSNTVSVPGLKHPVHLRAHTVDVHTFREIFLRQEYNITLPASVQPQYIIDAGANVGFTTLFFHQKFPSARIVSLEPDAGNFELLKKNLEGYSSLTPLPLALWYQTGPVHLVDEGHGLRGFMVRESATEGATMSGISIADLLTQQNFPHIDILKMDIEGSEKEIFSADVANWLPRTRCLIIELHDRMKPGCSNVVFTALAPYAFEFAIKGENLVFINRAFSA